MVHVLSASVLCEHNNIITARGSGFHFRHYFPPTCRKSTFFYDAHCLFSGIQTKNIFVCALAAEERETVGVKVLTAAFVAGEHFVIRESPLGP